MAIARPLPVTILTGFLGSGKTTLLNRLLSARHGVRLGVLVNDFGAVNIDARLVDVLQGESMSLTNGCVCCSMRGGLVSTTLELLRRPQPPEALLIEASGIADPAGVAGAFRTSTLRDLTRLDGIVAMVDAEHARDPRLDSQLIAQQIGTADIVVLNKIDLVDEETCGELVAWIRSLAPGARVLPTEKAEVPVDLIMDVARPAALTAPESAHDHASTYGSWSYETAHPLAYRAVRAALAGLPADVFRAKGTLHLADAPNLRFVAQMVGRRITIEPDRPWEEEPQRTDLVLIGRPEALSVPEVVARFDACLTESFILMPRAPFAALRRRAAGREGYSPLIRNDRRSMGPRRSASVTPSR